MLKFEKFASNEIHLSLRDKEHFFNWVFLKALCIAAGIHLAALFIFHISPIQIKFFDTNRFPIQVELDLSNKEQENLVLIDEADTESYRISKFYESVHSKPTLPLLPAGQTLSRMDYVAEEYEENPFFFLEKDIFEPEILTPIETSAAASFAIFTSGNLQLKSASPQDFPFAKVLKEDTRIVYKVQVDARNGKIFWFIPLEKTASAFLNSWAEKILLKLNFELDPHRFATEGLIEFHFKRQPYD